MRFGASLSHIGQYNENAVIHALRRLGPASQTEIASTTELSVQTVSTIVKGLASRGYLQEIRTESVGRGRPRVIMDLVPSARYSVGVHIDPSVMTAVVLDLRGGVVATESSPEVDPDDPAVSMGRAADLVQGLVERSGVPESSLIGACLAVPGPLSGEAGAIVDTVWLPGWTGFPIGQAISERLGTRVPVVKDTLAAVIGENWVRAREALDSTMVFVYVGTGTGVGLSLNGEPVRGSSGNAGEIGRILLTLGVSSGRARAGLENDPAVMLEAALERGVLTGEGPVRSDAVRMDQLFRELCALAVGGNRGAAEILEAAAGRIGEMVVMTAELLDANMVVFGGPYWELVRGWYGPAALAALGRPSARGPHPVEVLSTAMGRDIGAVGAACVVLDERYVPRAPRR